MVIGNSCLISAPAIVFAHLWSSSNRPKLIKCIISVTIVFFYISLIFLKRRIIADKTRPEIYSLVVVFQNMGYQKQYNSTLDVCIGKTMAIGRISSILRTKGCKWMLPYVTYKNPWPRGSKPCGKPTWLTTAMTRLVMASPLGVCGGGGLGSKLAAVAFFLNCILPRQ